MGDCSTPASCPYVDIMLREMDVFSRKQDAMNKLLIEMHTDIVLLKFKSGIFGAAAGLIPGLITAAALYISRN